MKNIGLSIKLNNKSLGNAGFEEDGVLLCNVLCGFRHEMNEKSFHVGGLKNSVWSKWVDTDIKLGDKIELEVITGPFDPPIDQVKMDGEQNTIDSKLKEYYRLKEELKDHIEE